MIRVTNGVWQKDGTTKCKRRKLPLQSLRRTVAESGSILRPLRDGTQLRLKEKSSDEVFLRWAVSVRAGGLGRGPRFQAFRQCWSESLDHRGSARLRCVDLPQDFAYCRQCLGKRRIPTLAILQREAEAWNAKANHDRTKIDWQFTRKKARIKFGYKPAKRNRSTRSKT